MSPGKSVLLAIVIIGGLLCLTTIGCVVGTVNKEVSQRKAIVAKSIAVEAGLDTMWKIVKSKAKISEKGVSDLANMNQIYTELVEGRTGGALFKMVTENYPNLGQEQVAKLYMEVMASVEAERKTFKREQVALVDLVRERDTLISTIPNKWVLEEFGNATPFYRKGHVECPESHPQEFTYIFVTAKVTKDIVETGEENDIDLFE